VSWERVLIKSGLVDETRAKEAAAQPQPLQFIVDRGWATPEAALGAVSACLKVPFTNFTRDAVDEALYEQLGGADHWQPRRALPLVSTTHRVRIALSNPMDVILLDEFIYILNRHVEAVLALPSDIDRQFRHLGPQPLPAGLKVCPRCEGDLLPIAYGYPGPEMMAAAERGEIVLGGCIVSERDPKFQCKHCRRRFF
jgi:hypothetical protein